MSSRHQRRRVVDVRGLVIGLLAAVVFIVCVGIVIVGQQTVGWLNLAAMLGALGVLIAMLALYNRRYR